MNQDIFEGGWREFVGELRVMWGRITNDEWEQIDGHKDKLVGKLQERYGWARDRAEREVDSVVRRLQQQARH